MVDVMSIHSAILGLKTAADMAKGFLQLQSMAEVQGKVIDLQSAILAAQSSALAAQSEQSSMIQQVRELEEEIARIKAWEAEKQRYKLVAILDGTATAYALKESCKGTDPPHWLCTKCYDDGRRTILQPQYDKAGSGLLVCPTCKSSLHSRYRHTGKPSYATPGD